MVLSIGIHEKCTCRKYRQNIVILLLLIPAYFHIQSIFHLEHFLINQS